MEGLASYQLAKKLFPICRSISGEGVRQTLEIIKDEIPLMNIKEIPSGQKVFDWTVPREWNIRDGYIEEMSTGKKIVDFQENNLHVLGYSTPVNEVVNLDTLLEHVYTQPQQPEVIPYVTSYYKERYGFCMSDLQKNSLREGEYRVYIDSDFSEGCLNYGEYILEGETTQEVFFSTYICHPSMANNELSGPCLAVQLIKWLQQQTNRKYTYRFIFIPETIGSIAYISMNLNALKSNVIAGYVLTCVGDDRVFSYVPSRAGDSLADRVARNVLGYYAPDYIAYTYLDRGSDERQYNSPGVDLPVCVVCRSKYGEYPEYHTSADNLELISPEGLQGSFNVYAEIISAIENNQYYQMNCLCEPQLGKRNLYPTISQKNTYSNTKHMMDFIAYADGKIDLIEISNIIGVPIKDLIYLKNRLIEEELMIERN